ncbi:MAG: hypothetical protein GOMPHAMPRED_001953 [Gomphillus americanus]|uniref:Uncharacterized protein n=1 Tax=Gomphillus americanus TaxID=1940652 RepID=A0A8H3INC2_9LECA|nr:MAG: hypothetical protein GOMPHAMPRED_001953 [Gomphillus americanus]
MSLTKPLTIFISGGSSGLGLSIAQEALKAGHKVIATSRSVDKAREQNPKFETAGGQWFQLDVTHKDTTEKVSQIVTQKDVDLVVNSAGYAAIGAFEDFTDEEMQRQFDVNVYGLARVCRGAIPHFRERRSGAIVNIGSGAGFRGIQARSLYAGTKFAVAGMTEALFAELSVFNIKVILVEAGAFQTPFADNIVYPKKETGDYDGTPAGDMIKLHRNASQISGNAGLPNEAANRILEAVTGNGLGAKIGDSVRLILGSDCFKSLKVKMDELNVTYSRNEEIASSTDSQEKN